MRLCLKGTAERRFEALKCGLGVRIRAVGDVVVVIVDDGLCVGLCDGAGDV